MENNLVVASTEEIRSYFPALSRRMRGVPIAYFDGPGGTQVPRPVVEAISDYLYNHNANTHWAYPTSHETDEIIAQSRASVADLLNCSADEVVFGQNMTTLTYHLARALGRGMRAGDEIVVTELDHHANVDTWRALEKERGIVIRTVPMNVTTGQLELDLLEDMVGDRTRLVAIGAASNAIGTINNVEQAISIAKRHGALTFIDAVHYAAHELVDVAKLDCDFLACSAYKFYGPHIGIMYSRRRLLDQIDFPKLRPAPNYSPDRAETGTSNHEGIAGAGSAVNFLSSLADGGTRRANLAAVFSEIHKRQSLLAAQMWEGLSAIPNVRLYGPPPGIPRTPTIAFTVSGQSTTEVAGKLAENAIFVSDGDFYAYTAIRKLAVEGLVRAGCACHTTDGEVERLVMGVRDIASD